ncbi:MAG: type II toxin-antitoxin system RelE/ParE family toxin [Candidatus Muiribacteriota bacterium]|jgi:phage-related protein
MGRIIKFLKIDNKKNVEDFINTLSIIEKKKTLFVLKLISQNERIANEFFKKLKNTDDIWEIKIDVNQKFIRIFCFLEAQNIIIATNAYFKKQNKTDKKQIKLAEKYKKIYFEN